MAGRGGLTKPIPGGVYRVDARMSAICRAAAGASTLAISAPIAADSVRIAGAPAFVVDPPVVDELSPLARYSGHPALERRSLFHALSQRAAAHGHAPELHVSYEKNNFIVTHMGGGISVGAHQQGANRRCEQRPGRRRPLLARTHRLAARRRGRAAVLLRRIFARIA